MEVTIVSEECIKPSSPTPNHLRNHQISFLDQLFPSAHQVAVLFYAADASTSAIADDMIKQRLLILKRSLSTILASFYPLAGRVKDKLSIDCNDEGLYYVEATVNSNLLEFLKRPESSDACFLHKLLPGGANTRALGTFSAANVAMIQVTRFACGGIAICVSVSHMVVDGSSFQFFIKSWAGLSIRAPNVAAPNFDGSTIFPQAAAYSDLNLMAVLWPFLKRERYTVKRFKFDAEAIGGLRAKASNSTMHASRVEAVTALICKSVATALKTKLGTSRPIYASQAMNIRGRAKPPFPESSMGNYVCIAPVELGMADNMELPDLAIKLKKATKTRYDSDFVKSLEGEPAKYCEILKEMGEAACSSQFEYIFFSSLCNMGFNDIDFGWGKAVWMAAPVAITSDNAFLNNVIFMDARSGDGIVARICLEEEVMAILEQQKEWISFAAS